MLRELDRMTFDEIGSYLKRGAGTLIFSPKVVKSKIADEFGTAQQFS